VELPNSNFGVTQNGTAEKPLLESALAPLPATGNLYGGPLRPTDYRDLAARWIDREHADRALLSRVPDFEGRELLGQKKIDCSGIFIPYFLPGDGNQRSHRIRRDHPEMEGGKPKGKYMAPYGERMKLYFPAGTTAEALSDTEIPIIVTEGEFKAIALSRLATYDATAARGAA